MQRLRRALTELAPRIYAESLLLRDLRMLDIGSGIVPQEMPIPSLERGGWVAVHPGSRWGGYDQNAWFHAQAHVPDAWLAQTGDRSQEVGRSREERERRVVLRLILGLGTEFGWPEGLLYVNGKLQQGINRHHADVLLRPEDVAADALTFDVRAWSGILPDDHRIERAEIALLDRPTERLYHLLNAGVDIIAALDESDPLLYGLAAALDGAYDRVELSAGQFYATAHEALAWLDNALRELKQRYQPESRSVVTAVGHGHLDVAWLWQTRHTHEKAARTFSIATALMDAYPDYVFLHTTPQVFTWLKDDYPALYERVKARVAEGRFEAAGAMWVESDCNLVSGESLVRQILYGQRFLREEFGREYDALWLPDAFGYSAALPQIMLRAGIPLFMTTKLSWSETNRIPADTFHWRGLDGSTVLAHFVTTPTLDSSALFAKMDTYNGSLNVRTVRGVRERYRQKGLSNETLLVFGHGDGGAGPTRQHLEQARAIQQLPGMPELRLGRADAFFERLRIAVDRHPELPVWDGDLYLEYHRGTYTTQSWLKRLHRQLEGALLQAEWLDAWHWALRPEQAPDRREALDDAWRTLLMHEFHDILPGSSIATVYWDARLALTDLAQRLEALTNEAVVGVFGSAPPDGQNALVVINPSPFSRRDLLAISASENDRSPVVDGERLPVQVVGDGDERTLLVELPEIPGRGFRAIEWAASAPKPVEVAQPFMDVEAGEDSDGIWLANAFFSVRLNHAGEIVSFIDQRIAGGREIIPMGASANRLAAYEDLPRDFDAWDIDAYYTRKPYPVDTMSVTLVERGPLRAVVRIERRFRDSAIVQRMIVYRALSRIDFETYVDWHEQHMLLKVAFPLDLRAPHVTYETQFGAIERPLHRNTSWEQARFEFPAHRWVDLSEADYGVSVLNDGRYGHDVVNGKIGLTLLRSPTSPDPQADQGEHFVTYSLYPHVGDWRDGGTVAAAYALNRPLLPHKVPVVAPDDEQERETAGITPSAIIWATGAEGVVVEAIKRTEDSDHLIVRLFEMYGARERAVIHCALPLREVVECDLLERPLAPGSSPAYALWQGSPVASHEAPIVEEQQWFCEFRPFEIRTFQIILRNDRLEDSYSQELQNTDRRLKKCNNAGGQR
jgi:alpha-mannosidase